MYYQNDLRDINMERAKVICEAITELKKCVVPGLEYTARDLSKMTKGLIPTSIFESCLGRGYRALIKREELKRGNGKYMLFGDWRAECHIHRNGARVITIKEYDEDGNLISEYQKRRGKPYYTASF